MIMALDPLAIAIQFGLGFVICLTGAMIPGPMFVVLIKTALQKGEKTGAAMASSHFLIEVVLMTIVVISLGTISFLTSSSILNIIGFVSSFSLIAFGILTFQETKKLDQIEKELASPSGEGLGGFKAGIVYTLSNPAVIIWWLTIGLSTLVYTYLTWTIIGVVFWGIGHFFGDFIYYGTLGYVIAKQKKRINIGKYKIIIIVCGITLIIFGAVFLWLYGSQLDFSALTFTFT